MFQRQKVAALALVAAASCVGPKKEHDQTMPGQEPSASAPADELTEKPEIDLNQPLQPGEQGAPEAATELVPPPETTFTSAQATRLLLTLRSERDAVHEAIEKGNSALEGSREFVERVIERYGPIDSPTLRLNPQYRYEPITEGEFPLTNPARPESYREQVEELYVLSQLIPIDLTSLAMLLGDTLPPTMLSPLQELRQQNPHLQTEYASDTFDSQFALDSDQALLGFIKYVADSELKLSGSNLSTFDLLERQADLQQLRALAPEMFHEVDDAETLREIFQPIIERLYSGSDNFPEIIVHPSKEHFLAATGDPTKYHGTAAFHRESTDSIETFPKPLWLHIVEIAHEIGHPGIRIGFIQQQEKLREAERRLETFADYQVTIDEAIPVFEALSLDADGAPEELHDKALGLVRDIRLSQLSMSFQRTTNLFDISFLTGEAGHSQLEETGAALFQKMALGEYARSHPEVGAILLRLADFNNRAIGAASHYGSFRYAEELTQQMHQGDVAAAFRELCEVRSPEEVDARQSRIQELNNDQGVDRSTPLGGSLTAFSQLAVLASVAEELETRNADLEKALSDESLRPEIQRRVDARARSEIRRAGELFQQILDHLYEQ